MNFDGCKPFAYTRMGGYSDEEDPTVLPIGLACVCKNCRFTLTSVFSRWGLQTAMQGPNQAPITGLASLIYTPENVGETLFQVPMFFDAEGFLLVEKPAGSGILKRVTGPLVTPPAAASAIIAEAYNRALIAYSNLMTPVAPLNVYSLNALNVDAAGNPILGTGAAYLDPYGQKPLGAAWLASTSYLVGEYVQPTATGGNGHLYRCTTAGATGASEPAWPLTESGTVTDGAAVWTESTPVLVNRLPAPNTPGITRVSSGGTFAAGRDVYLVITFTNAQGESISSGPAVLVDTAADDAVAVALPALAGLAGWIRGLTGPYVPTGFNVYEADVATGSGAPSAASFGLVGSYGLGTVATVTTTASGATPPTANTARVTPGGLQPPQSPTVQRASGAGSFPAGRDVYVIATYTNSSGETLPSVAGSLVNTVLDDAVQVPIPSTTYQTTGVKLYECDVPTGSPAPASASYALVGSFQPNTTASITSSASGPPPPVSNTSGPVGNIAPDSANADDLGVQGLRYASIAFTNRTGNLSGTVPAFTSIFVDVPGYELYMANIPIGPSNVVNRTIGFTIADGTSAGPFFYIPATAVSAGATQTATVLWDNTTTTAFFNFTDPFLEGETSTDMTDRLRCITPPQAVDVYYSPSTDRVVLTGVNGYGSGHYISLAADSESYYGDTSPIQVANGNGQRCVCAREFQGTLYSLKERSGFTISPTATDPSTWGVDQRWGGEDGVGPCGPRAACVTREFLFFVHRSGAYAYSPSEAEPQYVSKEFVNKDGGFWATINWDAEETVWCTADEERKELRIGVPVGNATTPNIVLMLDYSEGLQGPVHFTSQDGNEKYLAGARKWSIDDVAANVCVKTERKLPRNASPFAIQRQAQVLFGSSAPDGTVQMIQMGVYNDNGVGIDCQYETVCQPTVGIMQLGGATINATGNKSLMAWVVSTGTTQDADGTPRRYDVMHRLRPDMKLTPQQYLTYSAGARGSNEFFRLRFTNGCVPDAYFGVKTATLWMRPLFSARTGGGG